MKAMTISMGEDGNDTLGGYSGDDSIFGGEGDDRIEGMSGNDYTGRRGRQ